MSTVEGGGNIINDGLILCLDSANTKSYNGVGNTWYDLSRDYKTCTLVNGSTFSVNNGGSIVFDGIDDYVNINSYNWFPITTQKVTIESWVKSIGSTGALGGIISLTYGLTLSIRWNDSGGLAYFRVYDNVTSTIINTASTAGINLNDNKWHHIVGTNDGTTSKIYIDGVLNNSNSSPFNGDTNPTWYNNPLIYRIGTEVNDTVRLFNGNIGVVRVYNKSLTETEIKQNYNAIKKRYGL